MATTEKIEYVVEAILDKRLIRGKWEYLIKWEGYSDEDNTWEPEENCICPELMEAFQDSWAEKKKAERKAKAKERAERKKNGVENGDDEDGSDDEGKKAKRKAKGVASSSNGDSEKELVGFDRGLAVDKLLGATDRNQELMFLIKWKNSDEADLVPARIANVRCPQHVISFYEERLTWHKGEDGEDLEEDADF